ncbi:MAG: sodium:proton antiporter [Ignavibacteria bacterium]|nr:sodium:proton antiporter [Ignavibacteria bacterium]
MIPDKILIIPFILLLLAISVFPLAVPNWWHRHYPKVSLIPGILIILYYLFISSDVPKITHTLEDYFSFISLLFGLYVVSGGIFINIKGKSTPLRNAVLLSAGAVLSNILGTTGASMLLVRPYIESNKYRIKPYHIIFFIFLIGNIGGSLTPIGDPPLLLGYIKGVPFLWIFRQMLFVWLFAVGVLLAVFIIIDGFYFRKIRLNLKHDIDNTGERIFVKGYRNLIFLFVIVISVFIREPKFLSEIIMIASAIISYNITPKDIHERNHFNFEPIKEVGIIFFGIFATMIPALSYITLHSKSLGLDSVNHIFWYSGILTSFLDNAPTYMNFLSGSMGGFGLSVDKISDVIKFSADYPDFLKSVSTASVFFGAMTYIGNAPNFMIKSIAEHKGIKMPGFFEYIYKYSLVILIPLFVFVWLIFF